MSPFEKYLLRNEKDADRFRKNYAERITMYIDQYEDWFLKNYPMYQWKRMRIHPGSEEFVIGLLCLLSLQDRIQFSIRFPSNGSIELQREEVAPHEA